MPKLLTIEHTKDGMFFYSDGKPGIWHPHAYYLMGDIPPRYPVPALLDSWHFTLSPPRKVNLCLLRVSQCCGYDLLKEY